MIWPKQEKAERSFCPYFCEGILQRLTIRPLVGQEIRLEIRDYIHNHSCGFWPIGWLQAYESKSLYLVSSKNFEFVINDLYFPLELRHPRFSPCRYDVTNIQKDHSCKSICANPGWAKKKKKHETMAQHVAFQLRYGRNPLWGNRSPKTSNALLWLC